MTKGRDRWSKMHTQSTPSNGMAREREATHHQPLRVEWPKKGQNKEDWKRPLPPGKRTRRSG